MYKRFILIPWSILLLADATAQKQGKLELYKYMVNDMPGSLQPSVHFQSSKNWYLESRYNYEAEETFSLYAGKNFSGGKLATYNITPMAGYSLGGFRGLSLAVNADTEWKKILFSSQSQYSISVKTKEEDFYYSWSEVGYNLTDHFFTGISTQYTREAGNAYFESGFLTGISVGNFETPVYIFNPFITKRSFVLGVNYEFDFKKKG